MHIPNRTISVLLWMTLSCFIRQAGAQPGDDPLRSLADPDLHPFYHGVASGDPTTHSVILWTRVTPDDSGPVAVDWIISTDTLFTDTTGRGTVLTDGAKDYTVKVDATGLEPGSWYYYRFEALGKPSVTGRTRTAPDGFVDQIRFAVVSCSKYWHGYFNVYDEIARRNDVDAVIHLGDYIYEGPSDEADTPRMALPEHEVISLDDYRIRHGVHKLDPDSRRMHQSYPLIAVWDDHESSDNSWMEGADNHDDDTDGPWPARKAASIQAYYEWMPLRRPDPSDFERIFRKVSYGDLADIYMLDTRLYGRDLQAEDPELFDDTGRHLLGEAQLNWLAAEMAASGAQYQVLAQQVVMSPLVIPNYITQEFLPINNDQWDGYAAERNALFGFIREAAIDNVVVLTGDVHTGWAMDIPPDIFQYRPWLAETSIGVEFVCNSVTSNSFDVSLFASGILSNIVQYLLPYIKYLEMVRRGYLVVDLNTERVQGDYYLVETVQEPETDAFFDQAWYAPDGIPLLRRTGMPSVSGEAFPPPPPAHPQDLTDTSVVTAVRPSVFDVLGIYPNPYTDQLRAEIHLFKGGPVRIDMLNATGKVVFSADFGDMPAGRHLLTIDPGDLPAGIYPVRIHAGNRVLVREVLRRP